ncbi:hypothetical protein F5Y04DRAFT_5529 [Hypomontagnella monticulosa]|nr:hypothetical protein F5Y04DRAFT_5529 [Hypomontagnella monticulosa]
MAHVGVATVPVASGYQPGAQNGALTPADLNEIREYQKVVSFRDTIVSGKHPRIKVAKPATPQQSTSLAPSSISSSQQLQTGSAHNLNTYQVDNMQSFKANSQQSAAAVANAASSTTTIPGVSRPLDSGKQNNYVLQQHPGGIAKTGFHAQRERIEQGLREQLEQRKAALKASQPSEQLVDLDLKDILAKALTLVQATAPIPSTGTPNNAGASDASDSFDDNTFYSSLNGSPDSRASPRIHNTVRQDIQMQNAVTSTPQQAPWAPPQDQFVPQPLQASTSYQAGSSRSAQPIQSASSSRQPQPQSNTGSLTSSIQEHAAHRTSAIGRGNVMAQPRQTHQVDAQVISSDSGAASRSENSGNTDSDQPADHSHAQNPQQLLPSAQFRHRESPLVRAHNLSPFAPQPAHVSPLAVARQPAVPDPDVSILLAAPAQVAALRHEHGAITSPESSPQSGKGSKKGKKRNNNNNNNNKNKRKAETRAPDAPGSPYIKPEPRSPSPLSAPQFVRPQKRLRSSTRPEPELVYDEPRIERPASVLHRGRDRYATADVQIERQPYGFERLDDPYTRQVRHSVAPTSQRLDRAVYEERRPDGSAVQYIHRTQSPYGLAYDAMESRPLRSASYSVNPAYQEVAAYQRDGRMSVRPYGDRARSRSPVIIERRSPTMAPPPPPPRIIVDQYGREYIEPPRASTVARQSVVPAPRPSDREVVYGGVPVRAPSRMADDTFEENGIIYRRASPTYAPRRVITQPEYGVDYRNYRERDYSTQPLGVSNQEFIPVQRATRGRAPEDLSRDYLPRAASVRPVEAVPYYGGLEAVRPELPPRQYAASVHPEVRRDTLPPVAREFSVRPAEREVIQRGFSVRPSDRYYDRPQHADEEVTYIERPRAAQQEIVYRDSSLRQVYQ